LHLQILPDRSSRSRPTHSSDAEIAHIGYTGFDICYSQFEIWRLQMVAKGQSRKNPLDNLSNSLTTAVDKASKFTLMVDARRRFPASGIAYQKDMLLTADHVVEREDDISVVFPNGEDGKAEVVGRDPGNDLIVLRLDQPMAEIAQPASQGALLGQIVLAIGRPSRGGVECSLGVISAIGGPVRTGRGGLLETYLRTDAIPYPGFSGGPLVDSSGQIIGLNTSGLARGASLVIPVELAWQTAAMLVKHGQVKRGYLGVRSQPVQINRQQQEVLGREQAFGLLLVRVEEGSPADLGGLLTGDIIVGLNEQPLVDPDDLFVQLSGEVIGKAIPVEVLRGGQPHFLKVTIGQRG
jgi:serine protease DegQ